MMGATVQCESRQTQDNDRQESIQQLEKEANSRSQTTGNAGFLDKEPPTGTGLSASAAGRGDEHKKIEI